MANNKKVSFRLSKQAILLVSLNLVLLLTALALYNSISRLTEGNLKNLAALNQVLPGFNNQTTEQLKQDINKLEDGLLALAYLFDPPEKEIKKDYDVSIYFVEELGKVKQSLKTKAADKNVSYPELGFKEALPDEKESVYLLKQLYTIRDVAGRGMDEGVNFSLITPQPSEELGPLSGVKLAKIRLEFTALPPALINFLILASEIVPLDSMEHILVKSQDSAFKADMVLSRIAIEADWKGRVMASTPFNIKEVFSGEEKIINSLRANNPFFRVLAQEPPALPSKAPVEQSKQAPRFIYQGKAVLKSKEVAVIQDTLNQETIFLAPGEKTGDFILQELKELQIILKNINTGQEIIIKRQEQ